jgi:hypothetical protein
MQKRCYLANEAVLLTGAGFTPGGSVELLQDVGFPSGAVSSQMLGLRRQLKARPNGTVAGTLRAPSFRFPGLTPAPLLIGAIDRARAGEGPPPDAAVASATSFLSNRNVIVSGWKDHRANPGRRTRVQAGGFTQRSGALLYAHYLLRGAVVHTVALGRLSGPCGTLNTVRREFPSARRVRSGTYTITFNTSRRLPRLAPVVAVRGIVVGAHVSAAHVARQAHGAPPADAAKPGRAIVAPVALRVRAATVCDCAEAAEAVAKADDRVKEARKALVDAREAENQKRRDAELAAELNTIAIALVVAATAAVVIACGAAGLEAGANPIVDAACVKAAEALAGLSAAALVTHKRWQSAEEALQDATRKVARLDAAKRAAVEAARQARIALQQCRDAAAKNKDCNPPPPVPPVPPVPPAPPAPCPPGTTDANYCQCPPGTSDPNYCPSNRAATRSADPHAPMWSSPAFVDT